MTSFLCKLTCRAVAGMKQLDRGAFAIEHALFTSAGGAGCLVLSTELLATVEHGLRAVLRAMP